MPTLSRDDAAWHQDLTPYGVDEDPIADPDDIVHGWVRWRTAPDDYEDETWCGLTVVQQPGKPLWSYREKGVIDCLLCLGKGAPNAG